MLKRKNLIILGIAVLCGLIGVFLVMDYVLSIENAYNEDPMVDIIVAAQDIPEHVRVTHGMLKTISIETEYVMPQAVSNIENIVGTMTTTKIYNGEQIMKGRITKGDTPATFAYGIPDGKRAMSFALDPINGVAGFIQPHDRIDILLTLTPPGAGDDTQSSDASLKVFQDIAKKLLSGRRFVTFNGSLATFTLYQNIEVIAVGKRVVRPDPDVPAVEGEGEGTEGTLTLCLDPEQAEILTNAEKIGAIKYDLRNPGDDDIVHLKPIIEYKPN